jgi:hypothetical protein
VQRFLIWSAYLSGEAGHTYGANGIWQLNRREQPYGTSASGSNYGKVSWDEAMKLPGSRQVGLAKRLLETLAWNRFEPHQQWVTDPADRAIAWGDWIWYPERTPSHDAPVGHRFFRHRVDMPPDARVRRAVWRLIADDRCTAYLNGEKIGAQHHAGDGLQPSGIAEMLKPGINVLAVDAENTSAAWADHNPAGLLMSLEIELQDGRKISARSDATWRASKDSSPDWAAVSFNDSRWVSAASVARYGDAPWGKIDFLPNNAVIPYAAGIPRRVRLIYLPRGVSTNVEELERDVKYEASFFDPVTGERSAARPAEPQNSSWSVPQPPKPDQDWVVILEAAGDG